MPTRIDCRVCDQKGLVPIGNLYGERSHSSIPLYKCVNCFSFFTLPIKYQNRHKTWDWDGIDYFLNRKEYVQGKAKSILSFFYGNQRGNNKDRKTFLDIGCAIGSSLLVAQELGFDAYGIEPSKTISQYARDLQLNVKTAFFDSDLFEAEFFNFIMIDQVLEHVPSPKKMLFGALKILKPNGILYLSVPEVDWLTLILTRLRFGPFKKIDVFADPEEHINYFSRKAIEILVRNNNSRLLWDYHATKKSLKYRNLLRLSSEYYFIKK